MNTELFSVVNANYERIQLRKRAVQRRKLERKGDIAFGIILLLAILLTGYVEAL